MVFRIAFLVVSACAVFAADGSVAYVDSFDLSGATCGFGKRLLPLKSVDGHALTVSSNVYVRGFGTHPESAIMFRANGKVESFDALVAIDDDASQLLSKKGYSTPAAQFRVWADGQIAWNSGDVKLWQKPVEAHVDLAGAKEIVLETTGGGEWTAYDAAPS